jgi:methanogenic corrinoid protein MtbC1
MTVKQRQGSDKAEPKDKTPTDLTSKSEKNMLGQTVRTSILPTLIERLRADALSHPRITTVVAGSTSGNKNVTAKLPSTADKARAQLARPPYSDFDSESGSLGRNIISAAEQSMQSGSSTDVKDSEHWLTPTEFADLVLDANEHAALGRVQLIRNDGVCDVTILTQLLGPTSAALGVRWEEDLSDFAEVTVGVCRLHRILRWMHPGHERAEYSRAHGGRVALAPVQGEQHSFGLLLVGDLLYRAGWYTDVDIDGDNRALPITVAENWFHVAGVSLSSESRLQGAIDLIADIRQNSVNPDVRVMAGGFAFIENPKLAEKLDVDFVSADGTDIAAKMVPYAPKSASLVN